jgi:hypothetical protein
VQRIRLKRETYNEDKFLNQNTVTVARSTVFYCILRGHRKEFATDVCVITQQHRRKLTQRIAVQKTIKTII